MHVDILHRPGGSAARLSIMPGERVIAEGGAMIAMDGPLRVTTTTHTKSGGGVLRGLKRALAGESIFLNHYEATSQPGTLWLAPSLIGDMEVVRLAPGQKILIQGSSFVACEHSVDTDTNWQGFKNLLSGESLFWISATGPGQVIFNTFGALFSKRVDGELIIDTGHVVAFESSLDFKLSKAGGSWLASIFGGEGIVCRFQGTGRVWCQSHNAPDFGRALGQIVRPR